MKKINLLVAFLPLFLSACGGGGSATGTNDSAPNNLNSTGASSGSTSASTSSEQAAIDANINDFISAVQATHGTTPATNLTGIWIEAAGKLWTDTGYKNNASYSASYTDTLYKVHFLTDNGSSVDVSDCGKALTLYSFHFDGAGHIIWSNFQGDTKPLGTITDDRLIDFGTTEYSLSATTSTSTSDIKGSYTSRWIKLSDSFTASIGTLTGIGSPIDVSCTSILTGTGTVNNTATSYYSVDFRDTSGSWFSTSNLSGSPAPTRSGTVFSMTYTGVPVKFTLQ